MSEIGDDIKEGLERAGESPLGPLIAILVAIVATGMALLHVKDENLVQRMEHASVHAIDSWSYYQAKSTKQHLAENMIDQVRLHRSLAGSHAAAEVESALDDAERRYEAQVKKYEGEKEEIRKQAEELGEEYAAFKARHEQFSMADACLAISIALFGMTALTGRRWLLGLGIALALVGTIFGIAGFAGWALHPAWLAKVLG